MSKIYPLRIFLSLFLLAGLLWVWSDRFDELGYFLTPQPLQELGFISSQNDLEHIPDNTYVAVEGILAGEGALLKGIRTGSFRYGPIEVRRLLGSPIFVEYDQAKFQKQFLPLQKVSLKGRIVAFDKPSKFDREMLMLRSRAGFPKHPRIIIVDEKPFGDWRYPLLFLLSLTAVVASFWSAIRTASEVKSHRRA